MVHCADQMSDDNPDKAAALASQQRGARDTAEQGQLAATGLFKYDPTVDGGLDTLGRMWDWAGPGVVRGAKNFFDGGAADSASQFFDLMKGDARNKMSESPAALVAQGIANGLSAIGGIEGGGPTASPGLQLADSAAGQAPSPALGAPGVVPIPSVAIPGSPGYVPPTATLNSGGNDSANGNGGSVSGSGSAYDRVYGGRTSVENVTSRGTSIETVPNSNDATASSDFAALKPNNVKTVSTGRGDVSIGTLDDGSTVILRPSKDGRTTIEFQNANGRTTREIRYGSK